MGHRLLQGSHGENSVPQVPLVVTKCEHGSMCMCIVSQAAWDSSEKKSQPMPRMIFCKHCSHRILIPSTISIRDYCDTGNASAFLSVHAVTGALLLICATTLKQ